MKEQRTITNKSGLPDVIYKAALNDTYISLGDISVTALIDSPRIRQYRLKYGHLIETDVEELLPSIEGTALHNVLERAEPQYEEAAAMEKTILEIRRDQARWEEMAKNTSSQEKKEKYLEYANKFENEGNWLFRYMRKKYPDYKRNVINEAILMVSFRGWDIKGQVDRLVISEMLIEDYKVKSVWAFGDQHERQIETQQLNVYAWMLRHGIERWKNVIRGEVEQVETFKPKVFRLKIIRWYRDWQKAKALSSAANKYPQKKVMEFDLTSWAHGQTTEFIEARLDLHTQASKDPESVDCSPAEKWISDSDEYKVFTIGSPAGGRAIRVFNSEEDAIAFAKEYEIRKPVEVRLAAGKPRRCLDYCKFQQWCTQYKREYGEGGYVEGSYRIVYQSNQ